MKSVFVLTMTLLLAMTVVPQIVCAEDAEGESRFLLTGYGYTTYLDSDAGEQSFDMAFVPIFLYRLSDKLLFEAELAFEAEDNELETELEYAQIDWLVNDNLTVVAGKYLTPFGSFIEKLHPAWINKLPTFPLPYQHGRSVVPFGQTGMQLRGATGLDDGYGRLSYSVYVSNGFGVSAHGDEEPAPGDTAEDDEHAEQAQQPLLSTLSPEGDSDADHDEEEELIFLSGSSANTNGDLALGGRIALTPTRGFEIAASYLSGSYDELGALDATMSGIDFTYHHDLFDVRAEWLESTIERAADDGDRLLDQEIRSWYVQPSLRLSIIPVYAFNRLELVGRLANLDWGIADEDQTTLGLNYYLTPSTALRVAWERLEGTDRTTDDAFNLMLALGF